MKKIIIGFASLLLLTACGPKYSPKVSQIKPYDKSLGCEEIALEINEAEYVKQLADKNKSSITNIFRPIGYFKTYSSASDSIDAAETRVSYLTSISDIKGCGDPAKMQNQVKLTKIDTESEEMQLRRPFTSSVMASLAL